MDLVQRFINYTKFDTQSCDDSQAVPSTAKQLAFAQYLKEELEREGLSDVELDSKGYIYARLKSNSKRRGLPVVGFISHYDTSPDSSGAGVQARVVEDYDGGDIVLSPGIVSSPKAYPELLEHVGEDLVVTDGHTLLGADDKAGIAEIVHAMCHLRDNPGIEHGEIRIGFTPDEEIGRGAHHFDVERFGCDWAYTIDGGDIGELEYENFNAAQAKFTIKGASVHTGYAKGKMVNAARVACELNALVPQDELPETTEGYEGFYHLLSMEGRTEKATMAYLVRDHDRQRFERRKVFMQDCAARMNERFGPGVVEVEVADQYYNMKEKIDDRMEVVDIALKAMYDAGVQPRVMPIRGGTDGAQLSFKGLPCPNIFAGGVNFHGPHEFVSVQVMHKASEVIANICRLAAQYND